MVRPLEKDCRHPPPAIPQASSATGQPRVASVPVAAHFCPMAPRR